MPGSRYKNRKVAVERLQPFFVAGKHHLKELISVNESLLNFRIGFNPFFPFLRNPEKLAV